MGKALGIFSDAGGASAPVTRLTVTLTANTNLTSPMPVLTPGLLLAAHIAQDGVGGHTITWDSIFRFAPTGLGTLANTISSMLFSSETDPADGVVRWWLMAPPVTNKL